MSKRIDMTNETYGGAPSFGAIRYKNQIWRNEMEMPMSSRKYYLCNKK